MAGFFGFFNFSKPGKGVDKDQKGKRAFFDFWDILIQKYRKLALLSMLSLLLCIPVVTAGASIIALTGMLRHLYKDNSVFLVSDFTDIFKRVFWRATVWFILGAGGLVLCFYSSTMYFDKYRIDHSRWNLVFLGITVLAGLIWLCMQFYAALMLSITNLKLTKIYKNALLLLGVSVKKWLLTLILVCIQVFLYLLFAPYSLIVLFFFGASMLMLTVVYNCYDVVEKNVIQPYYKNSGERNPEDPDTEETEQIFTDIGSKEAPVQNVKAAKSKKIKKIK